MTRNQQRQGANTRGAKVHRHSLAVLPRLDFINIVAVSEAVQPAAYRVLATERPIYQLLVHLCFRRLKASHSQSHISHADPLGQETACGPVSASAELVSAGSMLS